jgi:hypothetical protein
MIKIKGVQNVINKLENIKDEIVKELETGVLKTLAEDVYDISQREVPVLSGNLKRSGDIREIEKEVRVEYNAPYAKKINYTHKSKPFFLTRAYMIAGEKAPKTTKSILAKKLR